MKIVYAFEAEFGCVMLLNGAFNEKADRVNYPAGSPLYVTALPLTAMLLPYTVKLLGGKVMSNAELARSVEVNAERYIVTLSERHNYVYSPRSSAVRRPQSLPEKLLAAVKSGDIAAARALMAPELESTVTDAAMIEFFAPYSSVVANPFPDLPATHYMTVPDSHKGIGFKFSITGNKITDIEEI